GRRRDFPRQLRAPQGHPLPRRAGLGLESLRPPSLPAAGAVRRAARRARPHAAQPGDRGRTGSPPEGDLPARPRRPRQPARLGIGRLRGPTRARPRAGGPRRRARPRLGGSGARGLRRGDRSRVERGGRRRDRPAPGDAMKFGLILAGQYLRDAPPALRAGEMLEQVRLARDLGFDSVWMVHHYLIEFQTFQPLPMLARIAADAGDMAIGTGADAAIARAARVGDAWMIGPGVEFATVRRQLALYRETLGALGHSTEREYPIFREVVVCPSEDEARAAAAQHLRTKYDAYASWGYAERSFENMLREAFIAGDPAGC